MISFIDISDGGVRHSNGLIENIRCELSLAPLGAAWVQPRLSGLVFKDIPFPDGAGESLLRARADGIAFENVRISGRLASNRSDVKLAIGKDAKNVRFLPVPRG